MGKTIKNLVKHPDADLWKDVVIMMKQKQRLAMFFKKPVDYVALNLPHYPTIVKEPMDLETVERNLAANAYAELAGFARDVRLIFSNAMLFNKIETHQVHVAAKKLSAFFETKVRELEEGRMQPRPVPGRKPGAGPPPSTPRQRAAPAAAGLVPASQVVAMAQQMELLQRQVELLKQRVQGCDPASSPSATDDSDEASSDGAPPREDGGDSPKPRRAIAKIRFRMPVAAPADDDASGSSSADQLATAASSESLADAVSVVTTTPAGVDPDATLDTVLSPEDAARLQSAIVELEDAEVATTLGGGDDTPRPAKRHRYAMSPADLAPAAPLAFRGGSVDSAGGLDGALPLDGSTSPLWVIPEPARAATPTQMAVEDAAE